jgi:hypothetical protein
LLRFFRQPNFYQVIAQLVPINTSVTVSAPRILAAGVTDDRATQVAADPIAPACLNNRNNESFINPALFYCQLSLKFSLVADFAFLPNFGLFN